MLQEEELLSKKKVYCCSNPNCKSVFSLPKVLKYYVCPCCQTMVELEGISNQPVIADPLTEEKLALLEDFNSILIQKSKEIKDLELKNEKRLEDIKKLEMENANLNKKFENNTKNLSIAKQQLESINCRYRERVEELVEVSEKNLGLSKRVEALEVERASDKVKMREDSGRIEELEKVLSDKDDCIKSLDERLGGFRVEVLALTRQRDDALKETDEAVANVVKVEGRVNQELEARVGIQKEFANLREKLTDSIRREDQNAEKNLQEGNRIKELELQVKRLEEKKQRPTIGTKKPKGNKYEVSDKGSRKLEVNNILNTFQSSYTEQTKKTGTDKEASTSKDGCRFYFGYLSERDKGDEIPNTCVECSKSLDCMLSKVRESNESVKEIKKWYRLK